MKRALHAILGLALGLAGCDSGVIPVTVRTDPETIANELTRVEVSVVETCEAQSTTGGGPVGAIETVEARRDQMGTAFGPLDRGIRGLYARGWDASCRVIAAGCATVEIGKDDLEVTMSSLLGPGCDPGEVCEDDRCVTPTMDAGPRPDAGPPNDDAGQDIDAGPGDAGAPDAGPPDAGPPPVLACPPPGGTADPDPLVLYTFEAPDDFSRVRDRAGAAPNVPLVGAAGPGGEMVTFDGRAATFVGGHLAADQTDSERLQNQILGTQAFTLEVWFNVADLLLEESSGPERLVTLSSGTGQRAFTVGPELARLEGRIRTNLSDASGVTCAADPTINTDLRTGDILVASAPPSQMVITFDETDGARAYVNGSLVNWDYCAGSPQLNWVADVNRLLLGDEVGSERTLDGSIYRVAIYKRALTDGEVACWFSRGADLPLYEAP